jgi:DNA-binding CsgD family transcriptional regulator
MSELEQELRELGGDITTALEEIGLPAALLDSDGVIRWQNRASRARLGDRTGKRFSSVVAGSGAEVEAVLTEMLCSGEPAELTIRIVHSDGRIEPREISAVPVREGGSVVGIFGIGAAARSATAGAIIPGHDLTDRQREVLVLLAGGLSTRDIAAELGISTTTARNHIANLMAALGVHTRLQAVIAASRAGLVPPPL